MGNFINKPVPIYFYKILFISLLFLFLINPFSWLLFFDKDGYLGAANYFLLIILDVIIVLLNFFIYHFKSITYAARLIVSNLTGVAICILIFELIFGNWFQQNSIRNLWIPSNQEYKIDLKNIYPYHQQFIINIRDKYGFRGKYTSPETIDILTVGGSTTAQAFINEGETWQDVLADYFKLNGKDIEIVNAGVDGQSTYGHLKNFEEWFPLILNLRPKYILYYVGLNDFFRDQYNRFDDFSLDRRINDNSLQSFKQIAKRKSVIYNLYRTYRGQYLASAYGLTHDLDYQFSMDSWTRAPLLTNHDEIMKEQIKAYKRKLYLLCDETYDFGAIPIFVTQTARNFILEGNDVSGETESPVLHQTIEPGLKYDYNGKKYNGVDYFYMITIMNEATMSVANDCDAIGIDLAKDLQVKFDIYNDYYDTYHNTPTGAKKIGKYLFHELKDRITN